MIDIKIKTKSPQIAIKYCHKNNINLYQIIYLKDHIILKINKKDISKIKKIYHIKIVKDYGITQIIKETKENKKQLINLILIILTIFLMTRTNINIIINSENTYLRNLILNELDKQNIKRYQFIKSSSYLQKVKENILYNTKDKIEWLNIKRHGMNYILDISPKVSKNKTITNNHCNVIATKESLITKIITDKGVEIVDINDIVNKEDILISGDIIYNEETKKQVCASGKVYGTTWYNINIKIPKYYIKKIPTSNKQINFIIKFNNKKIRILKSKYKNKIEKSKKIFSFFGIEIYFIKEIEVTKEIKEYTKKELTKLTENKINEYLNRNTKDTLNIVETKILKEYKSAKKIELEIFVVSEELISKQIVIE